ncbi:MAG: DUF459 domain-containing protein [Solirubrobacteraceae bacterium]
MRGRSYLTGGRLLGGIAVRTLTARLVAIAVLLGAPAAMLSLPAASEAACGGTVTAYPRHHPAGQLPPLAIGDSTMLLSLPGLASAGYQADAHGCRQLVQAVGMLGGLRAAGRLPHMVAIALGSNCCITDAQIGQALAILGPHRLLVLVTPVGVGGGDGTGAGAERAAARRNPGRIVLLDWARYSAGHPGWFQPDGLHLSYPGVYAFTKLLASALPYAYEPCPQKNFARAFAGAFARPFARVRARAAAAYGVPLHLQLSDHHTGYVDARLAGPAGTSVTLRTGADGTQTLPRITIPASGTIAFPGLLTWLCSPRMRTVSAYTDPAAPSATATVTTPSCARRFSLHTRPRGRVGTSVLVQIADRWRIGNLEVSLCTRPPGGLERCAPGFLKPAQRRLTARVALKRPGGWTIRLLTGYGRPPARQVWASHPGGRIELFAGGDSEMQILDTYIAQDLAPHGVSVSSEARPSTGMTNSWFFDWQHAARLEAATVRPDVSVFIIGANDGFGVFGPGGASVGCCATAWSAGYANLVAEMMSSLLRGGSGRVYWFLLPAPSPSNFQAVFNGVNAGIRAAARRFPGRVGLIDANAFFTPGNRYRDYMVYRGNGFVIHEADGIHLSSASDLLAAELLTRRLITDHIIR